MCVCVCVCVCVCSIAQQFSRCGRVCYESVRIYVVGCTSVYLCVQFQLSHFPNSSCHGNVGGTSRLSPSWKKFLLSHRYGMVDRLLGNTVLTSHKLRSLLTSKLVLLRTFPRDLFLHNLIGHLATSSSRKHLHLSVSASSPLTRGRLLFCDICGQCFFALFPLLKF